VAPDYVGTEQKRFFSDSTNGKLLFGLRLDRGAAAPSRLTRRLTLERVP